MKKAITILSAVCVCLIASVIILMFKVSEIESTYVHHDEYIESMSRLRLEMNTDYDDDDKTIPEQLTGKFHTDSITDDK